MQDQGVGLAEVHGCGMGLHHHAIIRELWGPLSTCSRLCCQHTKKLYFHPCPSEAGLVCVSSRTCCYLQTHWIPLAAIMSSGIRSLYVQLKNLEDWCYWSNVIFVHMAQPKISVVFLVIRSKKRPNLPRRNSGKLSGYSPDSFNNNRTVLRLRNDT